MQTQDVRFVPSKNLCNVPAYQGISGSITFDDKGDPVNKAVVILTVQEGQKGNTIVIQQVLGAFS